MEGAAMRSVFALVLCLALTGCGVELLTTTAIQGELQTQQMQAMKRQVQSASDTSGRVTLERAIQTYRAEKGGNPPSLASLVPDYVPAVPKRGDGTEYGYDPARGVLLDGPAASAAVPAAAPAGMTPADQQMMAAIRDAITRYGTATGYYPATLDALYPSYLSKPPRTSAGESFLYNNQNGSVTHPRGGSAAPVLPAPAAPRAPSGVGGAGPMGEVMTGIGMQQQLNSMGSSGASAAQGHAARSLGGTSSGHTDAQNRAMDQLGL